MNRISLVGRLRTQKLLGRTVLILLAFSLLTVGGSYLFVRGEMVSRYRELLDGSCTAARLIRELDVAEQLGTTEGTLRPG